MYFFQNDIKGWFANGAEAVHLSNIILVNYLNLYSLWISKIKHIFYDMAGLLNTGWPALLNSMSIHFANWAAFTLIVNKTPCFLLNWLKMAATSYDWCQMDKDMNMYYSCACTLSLELQMP